MDRLTLLPAHRFDRHEIPQRGAVGVTIRCTCGERFTGSNGEFAHQALERHQSVEQARALHPSVA